VWQWWLQGWDVFWFNVHVGRPALLSLLRAEATLMQGLLLLQMNLTIVQVTLSFVRFYKTHAAN